MYRAVYDQMAEDASTAIRANEYRAFNRCLELLEAAQSKGHGSRESAEALVFVSRLWAILLQDLAADGNGLPDPLRASLISIGIWSLRHAEAIRQGGVKDFSALIDVTHTIRSGLAPR